VRRTIQLTFGAKSRVHERNAGGLIADNLSAYSKEFFVRYLAASCEIEKDRFKKSVHGNLKTVAIRVAFLTDSSPQIQFLFAPQHCSWLSQIRNQA
jgi:hypothetical protein